MHYYSAGIPTKPKYLRGYDVNSDGICTDGSRIVFEWEHPDNIDMTMISYYEYFINNQTNKLKRTSMLSPKAGAYLLGTQQSSEIYYFEVYAVDMCGRQGEHAVTTYETKPGSRWWWPF
jgi:hypothetical protein